LLVGWGRQPLASSALDDRPLMGEDRAYMRLQFGWVNIVLAQLCQNPEHCIKFPLVVVYQS
jgi:hypothetical protein